MIALRFKLTTTLIASILTACGGGGGSSPAVIQTPLISTPTPPPLSHFVEYALPPNGSIPPGRPAGITLGRDGNLWFADTAFSVIGRITPSGNLTDYPVQGYALDGGIALGSDGNIWFTAGGFIYGAASIGKITPAGAITLFAIPSSARFASVTDITEGPDRNLWFTGRVCTATHFASCTSGYPIIGKITTSGTITEFQIANQATTISGGPDGNLWFTENNGTPGANGAIGRMTTSGSVINEFPVAAPDSNLYVLGGVTVGADHNVWFTQADEGPGDLPFSGNQNIYQITTSGRMTAFSIPHGTEVLVGAMSITTGADGKLWFTDSLHNAIGSLASDGKITEYPIPTAAALGPPPGSVGTSIAPGPNGTLWFTENNVGKIGRFTP